MREFKERIGTRSFVLFSLLGPILVLAVIYLLFTMGGSHKQEWKVLVSDSKGILENRIMLDEDVSIQYDFVDAVLEIEDFRDGKRYQKYDAMLDVNEKVISNKTAFVFYRNEPSVRMQTMVKYQYERRLEEIMVEETSNLSIKDYLKIKQPLNVSFKNVYDPNDEASDLRGWVGFTYGTMIFAFIFLFGMTILRSVSKEKSSRIVEVVLASVKPNQMLTGKLIGIGLSAFIQFFIWIVVIGLGLYLMRETLFPDMLDPANMSAANLSVGDESYQERYFTVKEYNEFVNLIYERIQFFAQTGYFIMFFLAGYMFYGALFAAVGATMGSESDGQQFIIPLIFLLCFALFAGYNFMNNPESDLSAVLHYLPFTSPVVVMVKLAQGYEPGHAYELWLAFIILLISSFIMLAIASRLYKNGILQFGHRLRLRHMLKWLRKT